MSNKALIVIIVLLLLGAGYWFYTDYQKEGEGKMMAPQTGTVSQNNMDGKDAMNNHEMMSDPMMNGTWKSKEDAKFTREFKADGTVTDRYEGDASATMTGTYMVVDPLKEEAGAFGTAPAASLAGMTVLKTTWPDGNIMYFAVQSLTQVDLSLINLNGRGNILLFTKMN